MSGYRVSHAGLVLLDSAGVCRYRWVAKSEGAREPVDITRYSRWLVSSAQKEHAHVGP